VVASHALEDRVVVVIGGTAGIGLAGTLACARAGARVVAVGLTTDGAAEASPHRDSVECVVADARDPQTAPAAIAQARTQFGRFDALYHVAGGSGRAVGDGPLDAISDKGWRDTLDMNLSPVAWSNRAAVQSFLAEGRGGTVLNITSVLAWAPSPLDFATHAYTAAKAGVIGLTRACAARYAPAGIRFNAIAPGLVETAMSERAAADPEIMSRIRRRQALDGGRIGRPPDLDAAVVFFLSDASAFVTGQVLAVDGGWTVRDGAGDA